MTAAGIREQGAVELSIELPQPRDRLLQVPPLDHESRSKLGRREVRLQKTSQDSVLQESRTGRNRHPRRPEGQAESQVEHGDAAPAELQLSEVTTRPALQ